MGSPSMLGHTWDQQEGGKTKSGGRDIPEACKRILASLTGERADRAGADPVVSSREAEGLIVHNPHEGRPVPSFESAPANEPHANRSWRRRFNLVLLNDIMQELKNRMKASIAPFMGRVDILMAPDYLDFVAPQDEMWLDHITTKLKALAYSTTEQFANDFQQIVTNCVAYNSPGAGVCGGPGFIYMSRELLKTYTIIAEEHSAVLSLAEVSIGSLNCPPCPEGPLEPPLKSKRMVIRKNKGTPVKPLPVGVQHTIRCTLSKSDGRVQYSFACPWHGTRLVHNLSVMAQYFDQHAYCREEWHIFARHLGEAEVDYRQRLDGTFCFRRETPPNSTTLHVDAREGGKHRSVTAKVIYHDSNPSKPSNPLQKLCRATVSRRSKLQPDMAPQSLTGQKRKQREDSSTAVDNPRASPSDPRAKGHETPTLVISQELPADQPLPGQPILAHAEAPMESLISTPDFRDPFSGGSVPDAPSPIKAAYMQKLESELHASQAAMTHAKTSLRSSAAAIMILAVLQAASAAREKPLQDEVQTLTMKLGAASSALAAAEAKNETCVRAVGVMAVLNESARAKLSGQGIESMGRGAGTVDPQGKECCVARQECRASDAATPGLSSANVGSSQRSPPWAWNERAGVDRASLGVVEQLVVENETLKEAVQDLGYEKALLALQKEQAEVRVARLEAKMKALERVQG